VKYQIQAFANQVLLETARHDGMVRSLVDKLGLLRLLLLLVTAIIVIAAPLAGETTYYYDWRIFPTVIAPVIMVMLIFALPLDMLMTSIFMLDTVGTQRRRLRNIIWVELGALVLLLLAWIPFLLRLLNYD
jgi:hypothetical protein